MKRLIIVVAALALLVSIPATGLAANKKLPNYRPGPAADWVTDPDPQLNRVNKSAPAGAHATANQGGNPVYAEGDAVVGLVLNNTTGQLGGALYTVKAIGEHVEVWVQNNLAFPTGDPRNPVVVTDAQIDYLVNEFDTNIYPKTSQFFREPLERTGANAVLDDIFGLPADAYQSTDGQDRVIAMISNVRDENYFDPTFPVYVGGFFSPTIGALMDRNVITIDAFDWANRVGPAGSPWRPNDGTANDRDNGYDGTFAHEYQHLLHGDQNPGEESWVNEGLSDWTEFLVGYGIPEGHWDTAQEFAENSLVIWEDQGTGTEILADYGIAFMFMHYLYGNYGEAAIKALFENQGFGIAGFNAALADLGINDTFADMYHDFAVARLVLANKGRYELNDIPSPVVLNAEAYSTPGAPPWGSDYLNIANPKKVKSIAFDGVDLITKATAWTSVADPDNATNQALWSGTGDELDRWAIFTNPGGSTLTFDTLYDIEEHWDFGFVMASTDNGATWQALTNANTTADIVPEGYPAIKDVLNAGGEGFSGVDGWTNESFALPAGTDLIGFRLMTDWGTNGNGELDDPNWYVDNVKVDSTLISDGSNAASFKDITFYQPIEADFTVDIVSMPNLKTGNSAAKVLHLVTDDETEMATESQIKQALRSSNVLVVIVTYDAPQREADYAPYTLTVGY